MQKKILLLGAGRSSYFLIEYLLKNQEKEGWNVWIGDLNTEWIHTEFKGKYKTQSLIFDVNNDEQRELEISDANLVISLLPVKFHILVAKTCANKGIPLITASYMSAEIKSLEPIVKANNSCIIMELGLDPGLDHISAMSIIDRIKNDGGTIHSFESFTGGLLAEKNNPWDYKFTWNPRNVVLAGQGTSVFQKNDKKKYIPYNRLFERTEIINIPEHGTFEGYANRDSLAYLSEYNIMEAKTIYRGTLRRYGFCKAWNIFVQLGLTDDSYILEDIENITHGQFLDMFIPSGFYKRAPSLRHYMPKYVGKTELYKLKWIGIFDDEIIGLKRGSPAQILEHILMKKWTMLPNEKDMIVMIHKFQFKDASQKMQKINSHLVIKGENALKTAMSKTVGLPLAYTAKLILSGTINITGVFIPTIKEIYAPLMKELENEDIHFIENTYPG
ncbi:MAG: saccharopine dehydrogenase C-terminal domain-containing protein [Chitinophagaceae bacterium]|nr:saccharopine dehydrogenase C-terminal domain-containing protein [Chitinophagaceae bacterium]